MKKGVRNVDLNFFSKNKKNETPSHIACLYKYLGKYGSFQRAQ